MGKTIEWDKSTLVLIHKGGSYARVIRLKGGDILCCFEEWGKSYVRRSTDNGKTWVELILLAEAPRTWSANPELLQLANGWILFFHNERPSNGVRHFTIQVLVSKDQGRTWKHLAQAYRADVNPHNGCWEPAAIQLPTGEIQLFFANENPYRDSKEQEITLLRSFDNGKTWSKRETVSFRAGHRDGMPVPCVLRDGKGIVVAIEDNGYTPMFTPAIIHTSMQDNWKQRFASGASPRRWRAVNKPISVEWGGAPYIRQMPTGETILSFQSSVGREKPQMVVYVGDENAKNFDERTVPFDASKPGGWWNSLFVKDDHTVTAISSCNGGVWAIDGHVVPVR
ncbi:MAG: sialidase family protein [Armatimonadetes bacterium]|nr:sialidase family protein [Armatimonadota bacterium]